MASEQPNHKESKGEKLAHEGKRLAFLSTYFFLLIAGIETYRAVLVSDLRVNYFHLGSSIVEALMLAKIVLLGDLINLGHRMRKRAMIVVILYRTLLFTVFEVAFILTEHVVRGLIEGVKPGAVLHKILSQGAPILVTRIFVMGLAFVPVLTFCEFDRTLGAGKLKELLFRRHEAVASSEV
jgi:hypothetical protein